MFCDECGHKLTLPSEPLPKDLSFDDKLTKIQKYLPKGLTEKIISQRDRIEGERKQVTVMFCDMEGFTPLSEMLGIEDAYSIIDQVYEILIHKVHDYEGTVNEMTGDGIMALFGAPVALEDAPQRGIELLTAVLPIIRAGGYTAAEIPLTCYLGEGYWLAGENDKARKMLERSQEIAESCGAKYYLGFAHRLLGETMLETNPAKATAHFEKSIVIFREIKAENELAMAYEGYGQLHKRQGQVAQAREYLTKALEIFERLGTLIEPDKVSEELAGLP